MAKIIDFAKEMGPRVVPWMVFLSLTSVFYTRFYFQQINQQLALIPPPQVKLPKLEMPPEEGQEEQVQKIDEVEQLLSRPKAGMTIAERIEAKKLEIRRNKEMKIQGRIHKKEEAIVEAQKLIQQEELNRLKNESEDAVGIRLLIKTSESNRDGIDQLKDQIESLQYQLKQQNLRLENLQKRPAKEKVAPSVPPPASTLNGGLSRESAQQAAKLYSTFPPDKAAQILQTMNEKHMASILAVMEDSQVALILTQVPPKRAAEVTLLLMKAKGESR